MHTGQDGNEGDAMSDVILPLIVAVSLTGVALFVFVPMFDFIDSRWTGRNARTRRAKIDRQLQEGS
jgi:hypothetical protein